MEVAVINIEGKETEKKVTLHDSVYGIEPNEHVLYLEIKRHLAAIRQGTHKAKERAEIKGSTRKIKKQKGTGTARAGSIKNPLFKGGGRAFGPRPRSYAMKLNNSTRKLAKRSALSIKAKEGNISVMEDLQLEEPKTKKIIALLNSLNLNGEKALFVLGGVNKNVYLSSRNLKKVKIVTSSELSTYDIMNSSNVIVFEQAIKPIEQMLS